VSTLPFEIGTFRMPATAPGRACGKRIANGEHQEHPVIVPLGGFKSVELNAVGWSAALAPTAAVGGGLGYLATRSSTGAVIGVAFGAVAGFAGARLLDARHDRRRWSNVPVKNS
jgi:hypothetical protein